MHSKEKACIICNTIFKLAKTRGQRDRRICYDCEVIHIKQYGKPLSEILGTNLSHARKRANKQNVECSLTLDELYQLVPKDGLCPILKQPMIVGSRYTMTLDKIVPSLGYTLKNTQLISMRANQMKNDATNEDIKNFIQYFTN